MLENDEQATSSAALKELLNQLLINSHIGQEFRNKIEGDTTIIRGDLEEILSLGNSADFNRFIQENGIKEIESYKDFTAKLDALVENVKQMSSERAYVFVKQWRGKRREARDIQNIAHSYVAISTTMDRQSITSIVQARGNEGFRTQLGESSYDDTIRLPGFADYSQGSDEEKIEGYLTQLREAQGRKKQALDSIDYKSVMLLELLLERLVIQTKDHIGTDFFDGSPIVDKNEVNTFWEAQRYSNPLPAKIRNWSNQNLREAFFMGDYDHNEFLRNPKKMHAIAKITLPKGEENPLFLAYENALDKSNQDPESKRGIYIALQALQVELHKHIVATFSECKKALHPGIEIPARNMAYYAMTTGEGAKVSPYWRKIHALTPDGHIDRDHVMPLASFVDELVQIAYAEGIYLEHVKNEIAANLGKDLQEDDFDQNALADQIEKAYEAIEGGENPIILAKNGNENWYVTTALFRVAVERRKMNADDGNPRRYGAVLELARYIRDFKLEA